MASKSEETEPVKTPETPEKKELSQAEKDQILREAVSWYLRNDFRDAEIREVCEEFIAGVDKAARATVAKNSESSATGTTFSQPHTPMPPTHHGKKA